MLAGLNQGPGHELVAWNSALIYDMIFSQPIVYELPLLKMDTVLMIGDADTTAIGSDIAPPDVKAKIGHYSVLVRGGATHPHASLIEFPELGHAPQMEDPESFNGRLIEDCQLYLIDGLRSRYFGGRPNRIRSFCLASFQDVKPRLSKILPPRLISKFSIDMADWNGPDLRR